ncbi:MAG: lysophospholipid acyltransferase family protein [Pseudobdellovibrionaceae bacterium]
MIVFSFLRSLLASAFFLVFTFLWSGLAILESWFVQNRDFESWIMGAWGKLGLQVFGVRLEVKGLENIPEGAGLFVFNHASFFDIFAMLAAYRHFRFGAKIELFKIPIFGKAMRVFGILPIARSKKEEVFRVYQEAQERAKRGEKFALSPEGKRNHRESLLPFKAGPFVFAINAGMPVVPVVIRGAHAVMGKGKYLPNWDRWSRKVFVEYLPAISSSGYSIDQRGDLQEKAYQAMQARFISAELGEKPDKMKK